jgi:predicted NBD/HSP70 family sugar kinase
MNILVIDVGGTHVKILANGEQEKREIESGPTMTAQQMVSSVNKLAGDWKYDVVSVGYPGPVVHHRPIAEPYNLGSGGWDSTSLRRSTDRRRSSMMQQCRRSAAIGAAECYSSAWGPGSVRP